MRLWKGCVAGDVGDAGREVAVDGAASVRQGAVVEDETPEPEHERSKRFTIIVKSKWSFVHIYMSAISNLWDFV